MQFASYLPDWPAYVVVFIAVIATAASLDRLSWPLVAGTLAVLALFATEDAFPSFDLRVIGAAFFCAIAAAYAMKRRFLEMLAILLLAVVSTAMSLVPNTNGGLILFVAIALAGQIWGLKSKAG